MATVQIDQSLATRMVEKAVVFCASKMPGGNTAKARQALHEGQCEVCERLCYSLALQVGEYLGQMDPRVKAVYVFEPEYAKAGEVETVSRTPGIHLIAWVERKTAALNALVAALAAVLSENLRQQLGCVKATPACYSLDVHMVDDDEVRHRRGMGILVDSVYVRPIQVWPRQT